jgi:hypothetical protein
MHRFLSLLLLLPVLSLPILSSPAWAADSPQADSAPTHHVRLTWEQRFTQANLAHDGHLTLAEAEGGYTLLAKHFADIDVDHKGYVTENDVRTWQTMRRAAHRLAKPQDEQLRPRPAFQSGCPDLRTISATGSQAIAPPSAPPPAPAAAEPSQPDK